MAQRQFRSDDTSKWLEGFGNGSDGDLVISSNTTEAPIDASCTGTAGTNTLSATNASFAAGQLIMIHKTRGNTTTTAGNWELNKIASYVAGTITTTYPLINTYNDSGADQSQVRVMKQYNNVTINNGVTWTAKSWNGDVGGILAFFAKGTATITGSILTTGKGFIKGSAGTGAGNETGSQGEGSVSTSSRSTSANGNGGGGGAANGAPIGQGGGGGGGGYANAGSAGVAPGNGGGSVGAAGLTTLFFGGAGGGGGSDDSAGQPGAAGGNGGGIGLIIANNISITGTLYSIGDNGSNGSGFGGAGGGGAGGSILLKCKTATLGTNLIVATAGSGGGGVGGTGGAGSVGRIHIDYKTSYTGTTNPTIDARQDLTLDYISGGASFLFNLA